MTTRCDADRVIVSLTGELDLAGVPPLRMTALTALSSEQCAVLVLDVERLTFVDSTGLGCWIELRNRAEEVGKSFELASVPPGAARTIAISGLAPLFGVDGQSAG